MNKILAALLSLIVGQASAGPLPAPGVPPNVAPTGSTVQQPVVNLLSPTLYQVPRTHIHAWKPFPSTMYQDSSGSLYSGKTAYAAIEIPDDATMAQVVFGNQFGATYSITAGSIWGSSQIAAPGYTGTTPGVTPYDASGNALTQMAPLSFGNGGADSTPNFGGSTAAPAINVNFPTSSTLTSAASGTMLNMATSGFTCPAAGASISNVSTASTAAPLFFPQTVVASCNASTGTILTNLVLRTTVPVSTTIYFAPPGITVAASSQPPLAQLTFSDWTPIQTYPRIDGPVAAGNSILVGGTALSGTVSSIAAKSISMSTPLSADIPPGTAVQACVAGTTSATITPNYTLQFASNANIQPGMYVTNTSLYFNSSVSAAPYDWPANTVASVATATNTTVTLTNPLPNNNGGTSFGSGSAFTFFQPTTVTSAALSGQGRYHRGIDDQSVGWHVRVLFTGEQCAGRDPVDQWQSGHDVDKPSEH